MSSSSNSDVDSSSSSTDNTNREFDQHVNNLYASLSNYTSQYLTANSNEESRRRRARRTRQVIQRDREGGHARLVRDYFAENPVYNETIFRRRFRMHRDLFLRIVHSFESITFFQQRPDAIGRMGLSTLQKCTAAIRMLAYGTSADAVDEYVRIGETTSRECLRNFTQGIIDKFGQEYLRRPTREDLTRLLQISEQRGFPVAWRGMFQGRSGRATIVLEAVVSPDLWIWHAFFGIPGANNDLNVLYRSHLFDDVCNGKAPRVTFHVNGREYHNGYYLTDGIYPQWASFVKSVTLPQTPKDKLFAEFQEGARKDVERAFGVLQARFAIVRTPSLAWDQNILRNIMQACIIIHNMIVENERDEDELYDPSEFHADQANSNRGSSTQVHDAPFEYSSTVNFNTYMANRDRVRDRNIHRNLKNDLVEHIWERFGQLRNE